jgi:hypothetical protein
MSFLLCVVLVCVCVCVCVCAHIGVGGCGGGDATLYFYVTPPKRALLLQSLLFGTMKT